MTEENQQGKVCTSCHKEFSSEISTCPDDGGQLVSVQRDQMIGTVFADRYKIISIIGRGGMSVVYKAKHTLMDRIVAIKVLHNHLLSDALIFQRFQKEAQAASSLSHPNIITLYDFGVTTNGQAYIVMDYLEGPTLERLISNENFIKEERAILLFQQICSGLDHAHSKGIIHRDLKPSNVVILSSENKEEIVKIVDFGIAKVINPGEQQKQQLTQSGEVFGSPLYMSPEQCLGEPLDIRSDIYSLGCLMYETLTGQSPIVGKNPVDTMRKHVYERPASFKDTTPNAVLSQDLEAIVFKCMEKDTINRFQSANDVFEALSFVLSGQLLSSIKKFQGVSLKNTKTPPRLDLKNTFSSQSTSNRPAIFSFGFVGIFIAIVAAVATFWPGPENDRGPIYKKALWQFYMFQAENQNKSGQSADALNTLRKAEEVVNGISDNNVRLLATLQVEADTAAACNDFIGQNKILARAEKLQAEQIKRALGKANARLDKLAIPAKEDLEKDRQISEAKAYAPELMSVAQRLHGRELIDDQEDLLRKTLRVYSQLLGKDHPVLADFDIALAECLRAQNETNSVRELLAEAYRIRNNALGQDNASTIKALLRLGQFDKDESKFTEAALELKDALERTKKYQPNNKALMKECLNSYADYLGQTGNHLEAQKYFAEAVKIKANVTE